MKFYDIKNLIAKAIQEADDTHCPDGYASAAGYQDNEWLSDWGAFLADAVIAKIEKHGLKIRGAFFCKDCGTFFLSQKDKDRHKTEVHTPHLKLSSKDRPTDLGPIPCGCAGCDQTFKNEYNAAQHRRAVHGADGDSRNDAQRFTNGVQEILQYLEQEPPRTGDAAFICEALLAK